MKTSVLKNKFVMKWSEKELGEVVEFFNGKAHENDISDSGKYIVVNSKFVSTNGLVAKYTNTCFSPLAKGDVAMVMSDIPNGKAIAKCFLVDQDNKYTLNQRIGGFRSKEISSSFLYFLLNRNPYFLAFDDGVNQTNLRKDDILECPLLFPSFPEQNRIVSVLQTWDKTIAKLTQKIELKKQIKKGLMQDLLTGKKRLGSFKEKWRTVKLGEIAIFKKGKGLPKSEIDSDGKYEAIHYGELFTKYAEHIENIISRTNSNKGMFFSKNNDILMPTSDVTPRGLSTASCIEKDGVILGGDILVIRSSDSLNGLFFCYIVNLNKKDVIKLVSGSTVFHLYGSDMAKFELNLPPLKEQELIVKILVTADKEISKLEKKLHIIKDQKKYLLNNLITGTIRTPEVLSIKL